MSARNERHTEGSGAAFVPQMVTVRQASELLHCTTRHVQNLMYSGLLPFYKPTPRLCLIPVEAIQAIFKAPANDAILQPEAKRIAEKIALATMEGGGK